MKDAIANLFRVLKPGGLALFRDYAEDDLAQQRLAKKQSKKIGHNFMARGDGTRAYYFPLEEAAHLWAAGGFLVEDNKLALKDEGNTAFKHGERRFVQGRYRKPRR
eukprot:TRINITY_DN2038_c0_g1_i2.p2 TRINITY_DN2038_c0_g1~~TRINITY_DN2038_c0_g1_i2.p2  ORF type:complete len:106 (-),score=28.68 TRINITY_DN2038_c0_g1_i2:13-330(-)